MKQIFLRILAISTFACTLLLLPISGTTASPVTTDLKEIDRAFPPTTIELTVPSAGMQMAGHAYIANGPGPHPTVVFLHGFPGNEKNLDLAQSLRRAGFNVLYFHYRGAWGSEGEFGLHNGAEDAAAAVAMIRNNSQTYRADPNKVSVFGHSFGGFMALYTGATNKDIRCTVAAAPAHFSLLGELHANEADPQAGGGIALGGDSVPGLKNYSVQDLFAEIAADTAFADVTNKMAGFAGRPLMIVSGNKDTATPLESQLPLVAAGKKAGAHPLVHAVMDADHSFSWRRIAFSEKIVAWMSKNCR